MKNGIKKLLSITLALALALSTLAAVPQVAHAADPPPIEVNLASPSGVGVTVSGDIIELAASTTPYKLTGITTIYAVVVAGDATVILSSAHITAPNGLSGITISGNVILQLEGVNTVKGDGTGAGINVPDTAELTIDSYTDPGSSAGTLKATGGPVGTNSSGAGIGGNGDSSTGESSGSITINGGTVIAIGGISTDSASGAGIGGGGGKNTGGAGGDVVISGSAVVTATGGESYDSSGAGIGGGGGTMGTGGAGGNVVISDNAVVEATGGDFASASGAGIGGGGGVFGNGGAGGSVEISGSAVVEATGGKGVYSSGAGIGGGGGSYGGDGGLVEIYGSAVVTATGGDSTNLGSGAGIGGGGGGGAGGDVEISGSAVVKATSGDGGGSRDGAGIGGGGGTSGGAGGDLEVAGGTVTAQGEGNGLDIGPGAGNGGLLGLPGTTTITGGSVKAVNESIEPAPTSDGLITTVYLNTLTIDGVGSGEVVTALTYGGTPYGGGMLTDTSGEIYVWLPDSSGDETVRATVNGDTYEATWARGAAAQTQTLLHVPGLTPPTTPRRSGTTAGSTISLPPVTPALIVDAPKARAAMEAMRTAGRARANIRHTGKITVLPEAWPEFGAAVDFDTVKDNAVAVRVTLPHPAQLTAQLDTSGYIDGAQASWTHALFTKWFSNSIAVIHFDHTGPWGQTAHVAAKLNLAADVNIAALRFYSYDSTTNSYRAVPSPGAWLDANGYLHFNTPHAGSIVVSTGELVRN